MYGQGEEASKKIDRHIIINVQGDVPIIESRSLDLLIETVQKRSAKTLCVDLISPIKTKEEFENPNVVKIVIEQRRQCSLLFAGTIPSSKKASEITENFSSWDIAFKKYFLLKFRSFPRPPLERRSVIC